MHALERTVSVPYTENFFESCYPKEYEKRPAESIGRAFKAFGAGMGFIS